MFEAYKYGVNHQRTKFTSIINKPDYPTKILLFLTQTLLLTNQTVNSLHNPLINTDFSFNLEKRPLDALKARVIISGRRLNSSYKYFARNQTQ